MIYMKRIGIVIAFIIVLLVIFGVVSNFIVVQQCGVTCECKNNLSDACGLIGCAQITLWDEFVCWVTHLWQ